MSSKDAAAAQVSPLENPTLGMRCNSVKQGDDQDTAASKSIPKGTLKDAAGNLPAALTMRDNAASRVRWPFFFCSPIRLLSSATLQWEPNLSFDPHPTASEHCLE